MAIRHSITLSTTEPNNEIGVIKIRQADEQTQTLEVQITENGVPKSYKGLAVYFCAKLGQTAGLGIIEQKLKVEEMTNPANGKLEYTMRAEDWQILGRQIGYFSFRKMKDEHEFIEQFTTRDFTFEVIKSVFSEGVKEVKKDGSTYVWTIEDLIRLFNEYMASGKSDWEEFVEQNREVLESVDPGGKLIGELIDARRPFGGEAYATLGERLDKDKADVTAQLAHIMINITDFGAVGDGGVTDNTTFIQRAFDESPLYSHILIPIGVFGVSGTVMPREGQKITFIGSIELYDKGIPTNSVIRIEYPNISLIDPRLSMRYGNNVLTKEHGTQSTVANYGNGVNLTIEGGVIEGGLDNNFQGGRSGLRIRGTKFKNSGEHCFYINGIIGGERSNDMLIDSVTIKNVGLNSSLSEAHSIQVRNTDYITITNSFIDNGRPLVSSSLLNVTDSDNVSMINVNAIGLTHRAFSFSENCKYSLVYNVNVSNRGDYEKISFSAFRHRGLYGKVNNSVFDGFVISEEMPEVNNCTFLNMGDSIKPKNEVNYKGCVFELALNAVVVFANFGSHISHFDECTFLGGHATAGLLYPSSSTTNKPIKINKCFFPDYAKTGGISISKGKDHRIIGNSFPSSTSGSTININTVDGKTLIADNYLPLGGIRLGNDEGQYIVRDNVTATP